MSCTQGNMLCHVKKFYEIFYIKKTSLACHTLKETCSVIFGNCGKFYRKFSTVLYRKYYWNSALSCTKPGKGNLAFGPVKIDWLNAIVNDNYIDKLIKAHQYFKLNAKRKHANACLTYSSFTLILYPFPPPATSYVMRHLLLIGCTRILSFNLLREIRTNLW